MNLSNLAFSDWIFLVSVSLNLIMLIIIGIRAVFFKKFSLNFFGIEKIQKMGAVLPSEWRETVWERGYLTRWQWFQAKRRVKNFSNYQ